MEAMEEGIVPQSGAVHAVFKGKRTKRQRLLQLQAAPATSSVSSAESSGSTTEEEEDMANCLILLAQGRALDHGPNPEAALEDAASAAAGCGGAGKFTGRRFAEAATATNCKAGLFVYECKTCSRCFPSFQALGGHRASHKKLKIATSAAEAIAEEDGLYLSMNSLTKPSTVPAGKPRIHECSICGAEFASGQALGGHMRRHRPASIPEAQGTKERSLLSLDLNLPAPSEEDRREFEMTSAPVFPFAGKPKPLLFSASALVGCHY